MSRRPPSRREGGAARLVWFLDHVLGPPLNWWRGFFWKWFSPIPPHIENIDWNRERESWVDSMYEYYGPTGQLYCDEQDLQHGEDQWGRGKEKP